MSLLERIGGTPLVRIEEIFVKLECSNPGGSVKDRIALFLIEEARRRGELAPETRSSRRRRATRASRSVSSGARSGIRC